MAEEKGADKMTDSGIVLLGIIAIVCMVCMLFGYLAGSHDGRITERRKSAIKIGVDDAKEFQEILDKNHIDYQKQWNLPKLESCPVMVTFRMMGQEKNK